MNRLVLTVVLGVFSVCVFAWVSRTRARRSYAVVLGSETDERSAATNRHKPPGLLRWLTTVDHRDIGLTYGAFAVVAFAWGGVTVLITRTELVGPGRDIVSPKCRRHVGSSWGRLSPARRR